MLAELAGAPNGLDRFKLLERETHDKPTVDARISYLCRKSLIEPLAKAHYHTPAKYRVTELGKQVNAGLKNRCSLTAYKLWLDEWMELPIVKRETPINVGLLKVYELIRQSPYITTTQLLEHVSDSKPTLKARLKWLGRKGLIEKLPKYNAGGNGNPDYYKLSTSQPYPQRKRVGRIRPT
ncbi:MAG: winged helix-turn-helix domain-containing protein [Maritalea sp.]